MVEAQEIHTRLWIKVSIRTLLRLALTESIKPPRGIGLTVDCVHWTTNVIGGWAFGSAWAVVWLQVARVLTQRPTVALKPSDRADRFLPVVSGHTRVNRAATLAQDPRRG